jgi:hypothetical protein
MALRGPVEADGEDVDRWKGASQGSKSDDLPDAVGSPIASIEDQNHFPAARGGEADRFPILVSEPEVRCGLSHGWWPHRWGSRERGSEGKEDD